MTKIMDPEALPIVNRMLILVAFNSAIGGFLFGYDTSSISAALLQIRSPSTSVQCPGLTDHWLDNFAQECITSFTVLGAFFSALCAGHVNDLIGRRQVLLLSGFTFAIGALLMGVASNLPVMLMARVIAGVGVGLCSHTMPCYVSECCPASIRGTMLTICNVMIVVGQTCAAAFATIMFSIEAPGGWRWILGVGAFPAVLMCFGLTYLPESPRWLLSKGRSAEALASLQALRAGFEESRIMEEHKAMADGMTEELNNAPATPAGESMLTTSRKRFWNDLGVRRALLLGCLLQALNQLVGINTIMYYGASVLAMASGPGNSMENCFSKNNKTSVALNILLATGQALGVMTSWILIEHVGRRLLILTSLVGTVVGLIGTAMAFGASNVNQGLVIVFVLLYVWMFGTGMASVPWIFNAEVYPMHVRAQCLSITTSVNWFFNFLVSETFLTMASALSTNRSDPLNHPDGVFFLYAAFGIVGFAVLYLHLPETKGLTLEETSQLFVSDDERKLLPQQATG